MPATKALPVHGWQSPRWSAGSVFAVQTMTLSDRMPCRICNLGVNKVCIASRSAGSSRNVDQRGGLFQCSKAEAFQNVSKVPLRSESVSKVKCWTLQTSEK